MNDNDMNDNDMNDNDNDNNEPLARLRSADPAVGVEPRVGFADGVVAHTLAATAAVTAAESASVVELSSERARRRPRWLPFVAVAASLALVGGAGFGIGVSTGRATNSADGAAPPVSLQAGPGTGGVMPQGGAAQNGAGSATSAAGGPQKMSAGASDMRYPGGFGRNSFSSSALSATAGTASAYTFDARSASNADTVTALAAALGVEGAAKIQDGSWLVGSQDGTAPSLSVGLDGLLSFYFSNSLIDPWRCDTAEAGMPCDPPTDLPSENAAIDALRSLMTSAGRDPGAFEFTSQTSEGAFTRSAQAWPVVDGKRIDQAWSLELTAAGVSSAYGFLADLVPLGEYPVVSEQEGFKRLSDPRFSAQMTAMPLVMREQGGAAPSAWVPPTEPPATPTAGASLSWPVNKVDIVSARLGLASQWQPDGGVLVVPAYEFTDADGGTWSVIAVADSKLDFATK